MCECVRVCVCVFASITHNVKDLMPMKMKTTRTNIAHFESKFCEFEIEKCLIHSQL